jgi:hypothetical protein
MKKVTAILVSGVLALGVLTACAPVSTETYWYTFGARECVRVAPPGSRITHIECNRSYKAPLRKWYPSGTGIWSI